MIKSRRETSLPHDETEIRDGHLYYYESFGTIDDLLKFMAENNIPREARICYMGCGTHTVGLEWIEEVPEPFEISIETQLKHDYMMGMTPDE